VAADTGHHLEEFSIRLSDLQAEELHNPEKLDAVADGKTDRRVQPLISGNRRPRKVSILVHVGNPDGAVAGPDTARQSNAP
jgi:hypothetical protein